MNFRLSFWWSLLQGQQFTILYRSRDYNVPRTLSFLVFTFVLKSSFNYSFHTLRWLNKVFSRFCYVYIIIYESWYFVYLTLSYLVVLEILYSLNSILKTYNNIFESDITKNWVLLLIVISYLMVPPVTPVLQKKYIIFV